MKTIWWAHVPEVVHEKWARGNFSICDAIGGGWENQHHLKIGIGDNPVTCLFCIALRALHAEGVWD